MILNSKENKFYKFISNISWQLFEKIARILSSLFIGIWIAKYLGEENFGLFSYALAVVYLIVPLSSLGIDQIVIKYLGNKQERYIGTALILKIWFSLAIIFLIFLSFSENNIGNQLLKILIFLIFFLSFSILEAFFTSTLRSKYNSIIIFIAILISASLKVFLIVNEYPLIYFAYAHLLEIALQYLLITILYFYLNKFEGHGFNYKISKDILNQSWPIMLSGLFVVIYMKIDQLMIMSFLGPGPLGEYSLAVKLVESLVFIAIAINSTLYPTILKSKKINLEVYERRLLFTFKIQILISVLISIFFLFTAKLILQIIMPNQYLNTSDILIIYAWSNVFVFLNNSSWLWFLTENLQKYAMIRLFFGAIINFCLNYFIIPIYGLIGAAYATLISYFIAVYLINAFHIKTLPLFKIQTQAFIDFIKIWKYKNAKTL